VGTEGVRWSGAGQGVAGTWKDLTDNVNSMAGNLQPRCEASLNRDAVANGDLKRKLMLEAGEIDLGRYDQRDDRYVGYAC